MKRALITAALLLALATGYVLYAQGRCGWYEGRMVPCLAKPIGADRWCREHDKDAHARIEKLLQELKGR